MNKEMNIEKHTKEATTLSMKKKILILLTILTALAGTASAQTFRRGVALGADRDTLLYIIASPFDNWYLTLGGGVQTFIGNELEASARRNKLNYNLRAEVGKWVIPDLAVSLRFSYMTIDGQSRYGLQPFVNYLEDTPNDNGYYPFHANAMTLTGYVTMDWTNFFLGYEVGKRTRTHIYTPIGLGMSMLFGSHRNPRGVDETTQIGSFRRNWELCYNVALGVEYEVSQDLAVNAQFDLLGSESTWDWSPYDNSYSIFDVIPSFNIGVRLNLLSHVTKYNPYTKKSKRMKVNHEFLTVGSRGDLERQAGEVVRLREQRDSLAEEINRLEDDNKKMRTELLGKYDSLQRCYDSILNEINKLRQPANMLEELIGANELLGLPSTIVYYQLDRYDIDFNGRKRLQNFVREISSLDDTQEFYIIGAADSLTGTIRHNQWLSERRCEAAYRMMVKHFNADENQFLLVPVGGIMDYEPQENNRMALIILRTPETEAIVERWLNRRDNRR